jgi:hypothetical protein
MSWRENGVEATGHSPVCFCLPNYPSPTYRVDLGVIQHGLQAQAMRDPRWPSKLSVELHVDKGSSKYNDGPSQVSGRADTQGGENGTAREPSPYREAIRGWR